MWPLLRRSKRYDSFGIIFDFDGTLARMSIDFDAMRRAVHGVFERNGVSPNCLKRRFILERIDEVYDRLQEESPARARHIKDEALRVIEEMELAAAARSRLLPGVYSRLWGLREGGTRLAIATRNCEKALKSVIGKATVFFDVILTRENSLAYKPEKHSLDPILKAFSLPNENIAMIGDHPIDVLTARAVGLLPVAVLTGTGQKNALLEAGPAYLFKHVNQAVDALFGHIF